MPTGYTSPIYNGDDISFKDFAIRCAKQFGAFIHMREDFLDSKVVKRTLDDYYKRCFDKAESELKKFKENPPTREFLTKEWEKKLRAIIEEDFKEEEKRFALKTRYETMLKQVKDWTPPTLEHKPLKDFMIRQLEDSIECDCKPYAQAAYFPTKEEYVKNELSADSLEREVKYYQEQWDEEVRRCEEANKWIDDLLSSLELEENNESKS